MPHKIILVEDDPHNRALAQEILAAAGHEVRACATAAETLKTFQQWRPDLFLLDIGLPDGNGVDLCQSLKEAGALGIPFIFLTGQGEIATRVACFSAGAQDYVQKPFAAAELLARVNVHLGVKKDRETLVEKNRELELRARVRQDLMDMVVHDMKSPLASIKGSLEIIRAQGMISEEKYRFLLANAEHAADLTLLMLNDFLDINQAQQVGIKAVKEEVEVAPVFSKLTALFSGRCEKKKVKLACVLAKGGKTALTDRNLLFRVLANLLSNAVKISVPGQEIELAWSRKKGTDRFIVSDRGPGVPDESKLQVFEKYTSMIRNSQIVESSSGIGLAFCSVAAKAIGAKIWVEDRPGGGSLFILEL